MTSWCEVDENVPFRVLLESRGDGKRVVISLEEHERTPRVCVCLEMQQDTW